MKLINYSTVIFLLLITLISCKSGSKPASKPAPKTPLTYQVDDNYILMSDVFLLEQGMPYSRVSEILKVPPYEVYSNVEDNCIIIKYLGKRALRIHNEQFNVPPPLVYYQSNDTKKLTYGEFFELHLVLDGNQKNLRSFFTAIDVSKVVQIEALMKRAKIVCSSPQKTRSYLNEWFTSKQKRATIDLATGGESIKREFIDLETGGESMVREDVKKLKSGKVIKLVKIANRYKKGRISEEKAIKIYESLGFKPDQVLEYRKNQFRTIDLLKTNRLVN